MKIRKVVSIFIFLLYYSDMTCCVSFCYCHFIIYIYFIHATALTPNRYYRSNRNTVSKWRITKKWEKIVQLVNNDKFCALSIPNSKVKPTNSLTINIYFVFNESTLFFIVFDWLCSESSHGSVSTHRYCSC